MSTRGQDTHTTLTWKQFECELCKMAYPYCFMYRGKRWNLVDLKRPEDTSTPYIILESLNSEKNSSRTIHTVTLSSEKRSFQMGRGHESDLRINDISVSRRHASLEYRDDGFYVVDYQSKFGTLVLLSDKVVVKESPHQTVQIGRTIVTTKAKIRSKIPEFSTNQGKSQTPVYRPKDNEYKFDESQSNSEYRIVEINGKRFLVKPEEDEDEVENHQGNLF